MGATTSSNMPLVSVISSQAVCDGFMTTVSDCIPWTGGTHSGQPKSALDTRLIVGTAGSALTPYQGPLVNLQPHPSQAAPGPGLAV